MTITRVTMQPGATTTLHTHASSEQIWIVDGGYPPLLLEDKRTNDVTAGNIVRTPAGDAHGLINTGQDPFVYLTATTPPIDLSTSYPGLEPNGQSK